MDIRNATYKPYAKPNNIPLYVHSKSNHPPNILKNIPESINRRLSSISCNETVFNEAAPKYQEALNKSEYKYNLKYKPPQENTNTIKKRKRNIIWFNPPFSNNVATNIGKKFLKLIDKCFPTSHKLHKILNKNTLKLSYSCMPNAKQIISSHNKNVMKTKRNEPDKPQKSCNCRIKEECPVGGKCLESSIIYQATVTRQDNNKEETYIGLCEGQFKTRFNNHKTSFRNPNYKNATKLSTYIWSLIEANIPYSLKWKVITKSNSYSNSSKSCSLCLNEKFFIIFKPRMASLNHRNELASSCRHRRKHLLCNT